MYVKTTLTSIWRKFYKNINVSINHMKDRWCTFQSMTSFVDRLKVV